MKTEGVKVSASRTMPSSISAPAKSYVDGEDPRVKAMWDEEFFGHELPPNYQISRVRTPDGLEKRKDPDGRRDLMGERAMWDEEFLGHRLPPNYIISRFRTPEGLEKKKDLEGRREEKDLVAQHPCKSRRHARFFSEDTFEYKFDKTVDSYVLSEVTGARKDDWCMSKSYAESALLKSKDECGKVETFEERALRFGIEDWNLVGNRKWSQNECKGGSKRSARRGIFHSPSGSDTSSMISTLESSSFSCGSEGSSFAKTDLSSSSFNLSLVYAMSGGANPLSAGGHHTSGVSIERKTGEEQFVEFTISDRENLDDRNVPLKATELKDGSNYFEFKFLDGKMVESEDFDGKVARGGNTQVKREDNKRSEELALQCAGPSPSVYRPAIATSPESENFFDSSHDSDWSGTHSASTADPGTVLIRDAEPLFFDEDNVSNFTEERALEDWNGDHHFYDADSAAHATPPSYGSKGLEHTHSHSDVEDKVGPGVISRSACHSAFPAVKPCSSEERSSERSPKKTGSSRKTRSLGSVLSHHLAFTAVPSLRYKSQPSLSSDQKESPAKVTAACIEWLWSEKDAMKPVQALRALAERENAERERIGSSPPVRNLDSAFRESRTSGLGRPQHVFNNRGPSMDIPKTVESPACSTQKDIGKESRDSILASWAAVNGVGRPAAARAKRSSPTSKVLLAAPSLKHCPKGGVSPRKRSVSFGAQTGSKSAASLAKQPVPKSLALELEVLCRPFGPVLKGVRFLPTAKRGLGRPPLFSNLGPQLASSSSSSSVTLPVVLNFGRLQCVVSRDGLPSYSLIMDETEEIFAAKTLRVDVGLQDGVSHVYTFHSFKGKGKGKSGWRQWGKKEKPGSDFAGNMTVTSTICPVVSSNGVQNFVESEFVLFDAKIKEISISGPTSTSPYPRSSFSSWDMATPQRSPQGPSSSYSSPSSTYFSLPSPTGAFCTPASYGGTTSVTVPSHHASLSTHSVAPPRASMSFDKGASRSKQLDRHLSLTSPLHPSIRVGNSGFPESVSDSETVDDFESRTWAGLPQSQSELAAVVVRTPLERAQGKVAPSGDKWGWGINFLRKSFDSTRSATSPEQCVPPGESPSRKDGVREKAVPTTCEVYSSGSTIERCKNCTDQRCVTSCSVEEQSQGGLNITLILPSGEHGCSTNGIDGPQPLIERWRSGGKCDCGSWDLGCGLTVVGSQRVEHVETPGKGQSRDNTLRLYVEGKKLQTVGLALAPLKEGCYTLGFQAPISPLHAFATAVAVLHSRDPIVAAKKAGEMKKRLTRIPVKVVPASSRLFCRQDDESSGSRSLVSYKLVCPDPPSSPFGRA